MYGGDDGRLRKPLIYSLELPSTHSPCFILTSTQTKPGEARSQSKDRPYILKK